jgi:calcineurin-like phosphoesterase family protein
VSAVWFTSDLHLGHKRVSELRGFNTPEEHDVTLIDNWEKVVKKDDQVWVLGDVTLSNPEYALTVISEMPGKKHLITGNHDPVHPMHRQSQKVQARWMEVFESVQAFARRRVAGQDVLLSHFPYHTDRGPEIRYPQYRLPDCGQWLLHGHTHSAVAWTSPREIHVGLDAWGLSPVSLNVLEYLVKS